jgi:pimeloyl-ACP methyl ester carboxylesterase
LDRESLLVHPVTAVGVSFGAVVVLRAQSNDSRLRSVVAISPYANLGDAVLNIKRQYAKWLPAAFVNAGLRNLPSLLEVDPCELNPECWLSAIPDRNRTALFIAGEQDQIAPVSEVRRLHGLADARSGLVIVPNAAHEALPFYLDQLASEILAWLEGALKPATNEKFLAH